MILALETSSRRGSVALFDGSRVLARQTWDEPAARHTALHPTLQQVMAEAGAGWNHLRALAAGRGPGAFSGVRAGLVTAQLLALPGALPVLAVSSGEALAMALREEAGARPIVIAGDARRGMIWFAVFRGQGADVRKQVDWTLAPAAEFINHLPEGACIASPDWARLSAVCGPQDGRFHWIGEDRYPAAEQVARWAWRQLEAGLPGEPVEPLYLHPPV